MDVDSGRILYQNNAYEKKLIASTTKIMTFVVAYEYAKDFLDVYVEAGNEILKMYGTSIYLSLNEKMLLRDLLSFWWLHLAITGSLPRPVIMLTEQVCSLPNSRIR